MPGDNLAGGKMDYGEESQHSITHHAERVRLKTVYFSTKVQ
jgi:hypothetical protein